MSLLQVLWKVHIFQCSFLTFTKLCYYNSHNLKKNGPSKSSVSVLSLTGFCIYVRLQIKYDFSKLEDSENSIEIALCHFNYYVDYIEHFQPSTSI